MEPSPEGAGCWRDRAAVRSSNNVAAKELLEPRHVRPSVVGAGRQGKGTGQELASIDGYLHTTLEVFSKPMNSLTRFEVDI